MTTVFDRRGLLLHSLAFFGTYALLGEIRASGAEVDSNEVRRWLVRHRELALGLRAGSIQQKDWNAGVEELSKEADIGALLAEIQRSKSIETPSRILHNPARRELEIADADGQPMKLPYELTIVQFEGGKDFLPPHAHQNMVAVHMVTEGKLRVRAWNRVSDEQGALIIHPTSDEIGEVGFTKSMTSAKENVHWFAPRSAKAAMLNIKIGNLGAKDTQEAIDIMGAHPLADGSLRVRTMTFDEAFQRYTADM